MVKLFIGNLPREATEQEIRSLFEQYGKVLECDIIKNYGFVHIEDKTAAEDAIRNLHHYKLHGVNINVEASKNKSKASTKLHVGNISPTCTNQELRAKFEEYGPVIECDIVKDYAFVHMERAEDAVEAIRGLDNTEFQGSVHGAALAAVLIGLFPMVEREASYRITASRTSIAFCDTAKMAGGDKMDRSSLWSLRCSECSGLRGPEEIGEANECMCSCPPAGLGLRPGWETRAAAIGAGKRGTGPKSAR
nr:PREDICTED: RNA-binding protein 4B isoform X2 [Rhinolophus sinicus]